jgi:hypothetical protein
VAKVRTAILAEACHCHFLLPFFGLSVTINNESTQILLNRVIKSPATKPYAVVQEIIWIKRRK